jgi:hypothetical protein
MAIKPSVHTESIVSINRSNCLKNLPNFRCFFNYGDKKTPNFLSKNYFYFNRTIEGSILIVLIDTIDHALH